ncbi:MAG: hypothetical protein IPN02_08060 [Candidatus Microthrix sp.]|uniref:Uncharacterized protein n=1 Tax=Candidatus Neomicrothrix subdominans TaxID=2954438 RepID=A0A936NC87_9ACTN|nr:hypothetical protein [Candidatus Microthrix subdominans]
MSNAQSDPSATINIPDVADLKRAGEALEKEDKHLRSKVNHVAADARFRADRLESINPVIVDGFVDAVAAAEGWLTSPGPAVGIRRLQALTRLPAALGGGSSKLFAADGGAVQQAKADGVTDLEDVAVLGPTEDSFAELVRIAVDMGRSELLRRKGVVDTGSLTNYPADL